MTAGEVRVIGIDPGPTPGIVLLDRIQGGQIGGAYVVQCDHHSAPVVLRALLEVHLTPTIVQVEKFVVGRRASRSAHASAGGVTRDLVGELTVVFDDYDSTPNGRLGGHLFQRTAAQVKPWATDARLDAVGLLEATKGMRHARDAARHALFAAVHDGKIPDPLSKRSN